MSPVTREQRGLTRRSFLRAAGALAGAGALELVADACGGRHTAAPPGPVYYLPSRRGQRAELDVDVCVYGATAGGAMAAIAAARAGARVALLAFGEHIGGMTTGGLSATDVGAYATISGLAHEFYTGIGARYGSPGPVWNFEPRAASAVLAGMLAAADVAPLTIQPLAGVRRQGSNITALVTESGTVVRARQYVDASYEGDLLARTGVSCTVGREANATYGETLNGVRPAPPGNGFTTPVSAYRTPGSARSGLLPGIEAALAGEPGSGDEAIMAYGFRPCITTASARRSFPRPASYDPADWDLLARVIDGGEFDVLNFRVALPNAKFDLNANGGISTDAVGLGAGWAEADYPTRQTMFQAHLAYDQGLLWFLTHDERVHPRQRAEVGRFGLPWDEFPTTGGWPPELYVREARRLVSDHVVTEHHARGTASVHDPVTLASYKIDSHPCRRLAVSATATDEGTVSTGVPRPWGIGLGSLLPRPDECTNLTVATCVAASHVAWSSLRMEPVFMMLGQAAGTVAALAGDTPVHSVAYPKLAGALRAGGLELEAA